MKLRFILLSCFLCSCLTAQNSTSAPQSAAPATNPAVSGNTTAALAPNGVEIDVPSSEPWTDAKLDLHPGDVVSLTAALGRGGCNPDGKKEAASNLPVSGGAAGALIAKLSSDSTTPLLIGSNKQIKVDQAGHLYLGLNQSGTAACHGSVKVTLRLTPAPSIQSKVSAAAQTWLGGQFGTGTPAVSPASPGIGSTATSAAIKPSAPTQAPAVVLRISSTKLDSTLSKDIDDLPRRVNDQFHNLGDMVNFVIVGTEGQLQAALTDANWRLADQNTQEAVVKAIIQTYEKKDYLQMPMSVLYLFNRPQDFGYEQAEAYSVVASRHHFRVWKAPFTFDGKTVWVGAGTHDIGFEKDVRNGQVTHKIDPNVDGERDHIGESLEKIGKVQTASYYLPSNPVQEARNATGGTYRSDGRILVMFLK